MSEFGIEITKDADIEWVSKETFECLRVLKVPENIIDKINLFCQRQVKKEGVEKYLNYYRVLAKSIEVQTGIPVIDRKTGNAVWRGSKYYGIKIR